MEEKNILNKDSVFVISVCRNEDKYIAPFINALLDSTFPVHIVIVDNNSDDVSKKELQHFSDCADILWQNKNMGFGIANNIGIQYALDHGADYVFLLNMDMFITPQTVQTLLQISKQNPDYAIVSPICFNFEKNEFEIMFYESITVKNKNFLEDGRLFFSEIYLHHPFSKKIYGSSYVNAAHWFMPRQAVKKMGGFNPVFYPIYGEDEEYLNRVIRYGWKVGFTPQATVFHDTENRGKSSLPKVHFFCINDYVAILNADSWCSFYRLTMFLLISICKNILLLRRKNLQFQYLRFRSLLCWKKMLKKSWLTNQKKEPIPFYQDLTSECHLPYL